MKLLLFFLLCLMSVNIAEDPQNPSMGAVAIGSSSICPQYLCQTSQLKSSCATYSNEDVIMERCFDDWYCDWSESSSRNYQYGKCILKRKHWKFRKNIGEFCYQKEDCKSYSCILNKCSVLQQNQACENSYQCDKGLLCDPDSNTCSPWLANDASCSARPSMCNPQAGCVSVDNSLAVCTKYFSLTTNAFSILNSGMYKEAGNSFFCESGNKASTDNRCLQTPLTLTGGYPLTCTADSDCTASSDASRYTSCNCWPNTQGAKYCFPFPGDVPEMIKLAKEKANKDFSNCYNFEIMANLNNCGFLSILEYTDWAPQIKAGTWGSCYGSVNMSIATQVSMSYTGSSTGTCPAIKCLDKGNNAEGYCFAYYKESFLYYIQNCPEGYICGNLQNGDYSLQSASVSCKPAWPKDSRHKDQSCWIDSDCMSGMCGINKYCTVYTEGSSCTSDNQCDRSLLCRPSSLASTAYTCQQWLNIDAACTTSTYYLCRPGSLCISSTNSDVGTCQGFYSVAGGSGYYQITSVGASKGTSSSMCRSGSYNQVTNVCFAEPDKLSTFPLKCTDNIDCKSSNYNTLGQSGSDGSCVCMPNTQGYKYCKPFTANIDSDYYEWAYNYYKRDLSNCFNYEIGAAFGGSCEMGKRYHDVWQKSIPSEFFPSCGKDVLYDQDRYQANQEDNCIFLYVFSPRLITSIILLFGILLLK